jgi:hypothetical protein
MSRINKKLYIFILIFASLVGFLTGMLEIPVIYPIFYVLFISIISMLKIIKEIVYERRENREITNSANIEYENSVRNYLILSMVKKDKNNIENMYLTYSKDIWEKIRYMLYEHLTQEVIELVYQIAFEMSKTTILDQTNEKVKWIVHSMNHIESLLVKRICYIKECGYILRFWDFYKNGRNENFTPEKLLEMWENEDLYELICCECMNDVSDYGNAGLDYLLGL